MNKKWFDPRASLQLPEPLSAAFCVSEDEARKLLTCTQASPKLFAEAGRLFQRLARMTPAERLSTNLRTLVGLLATKTVNSVIPDGLTQHELDALIVLQTRGLPLQLLETAQGLLNIYERYSLLAAVSRMFRVERGRTWEIDLDCFQVRASGGTQASAVSRQRDGCPGASELSPGQERSGPCADQATE